MLFLVNFILFSFMYSLGLTHFHCNFAFDVEIIKTINNCVSGICNSSYHVKIDLTCDDAEINSLTAELVKFGFQPKLVVFEKHEKRSSQHFIDTVLISSMKNECQNKMVDERKCIHHSEKCENNSSFSPSEVVPRDLYWIAILPVSEMTDFMEITVYNNDLGTKVAKKRMIKFFKSFVDLSGIKLPSEVERSIFITEDAFHVHKGCTSDWHVLLNNDYAMVSNTEFQDIKFIKINLDNIRLSQPVICHDAKSEILDILFLASRMLILTKYGLVEIIYKQETDGQIILLRCLTSLSVLGQSNKPKYIVAIDKKNASLIYWHWNLSSTIAGNESFLDFSYWLGSDYIILDALTLINMDHMVLLLQQSIGEEHIFRVAYVNKNNNSWEFNLRSMRIRRNVSRISVASTFYIYIWGEAVYCSLDAGNHFTEINFDSSDKVVNFWSGNLNKFVFQTTSLDLWYGYCGSSSAQKLNIVPTRHFSHLVYFFNSHDEFKEILLHDESASTCLTLQNVDIVFNFPVETPRNYDALKRTCCYNERLKLRKSDEEDNIEREGLCLFEEIHVISESFKSFSRTLPFQQSLRNRSGSEILKEFDESLDNDFLSYYTPNTLTSQETFVDDMLFAFAEISLDLLQCFTMDIQFEICHAYITETRFLLDFWKHNDIQMDFFTIHEEYLDIKVEKLLNYLDGVVSFNIKICDTGYSHAKILPGDNIINTFVHFQVFPSNLFCIVENNLKNIALTFRHGCPSRKKMKIDFVKSHGKKNHHCEENIVNCFLYEFPFEPLFYLEDEISGSIETFDGMYNMTIIAGGETEEKMKYYSENEIVNYNFKRGSPSRIWSWVNQDSIKYGHQWLCSMSSPCANLYPDDVGATSFYFFVIRFDNKNNDSNCDHSFNFTIKLHGMSPDSLHHALPIIIITAFFSTLVFAFIFYVETRYRQNFVKYRRSIVTGLRNFLKSLDYKSGKIEPLEIIHVHSAVRVKVEDWMTTSRISGRRLTFEDEIINHLPEGDKIITTPPTQCRSRGTSMTSIHRGKDML